MVHHFYPWCAFITNKFEAIVCEQFKSWKHFNFISFYFYFDGDWKIHVVGHFNGLVLALFLFVNGPVLGSTIFLYTYKDLVLQDMGPPYHLCLFPQPTTLHSAPILPFIGSIPHISPLIVLLSFFHIINNN